jgi:hypothetical protein
MVEGGSAVLYISYMALDGEVLATSDKEEISRNVSTSAR